MVRFVAGVLVLVLTACSGASQSPGTLPPTLVAPPPSQAASPPATRVLPSPSVALPSPTPLLLTPTPIPPATPVPVLPLRISAELDPPTPHAGEEFVLVLKIANDGPRPARGVYVATSGPWDRWTVLDVQPSGSFERDAAGWHVVSVIEIPPGEERSVEVHIRADEPAQEQLTFAVREAEPGELNP
jgi:hypothetical protein